MEKLKVLFISAANSIHTVKWVNALSNEFEVHLAYCKNHKPNLDVIDSKVILHELYFKSPFGYYLNALQIKKIFNHIKPNVVNVHYASGYGTLARIAKVKPVLLSIWGSDVYEFPHKSLYNKKTLYKNIFYADELASTSVAMAKELKKLFPDIQKEIFITPFGVNVEKFQKKESKHDTFNIGNIKSLEDVYDIKTGILAIKRLKENLINKKEKKLSEKIKFYIYGDGSLKDELNKLIIDNELASTVFLKGKIPNESVPNALSELDVFCITSKKESFGVSIVEAMACEVPVVATDADGFKEVVEQNKTGYIVKVGDIDALAQSLEKLLNDKLLRQKFGKNGRSKVLKYYDWDNNVKEMMRIYEKINKAKK